MDDIMPIYASLCPDMDTISTLITDILYVENTDDRWLRTLEGPVMRTRRFGEDQIQ